MITLNYIILVLDKDTWNSMSAFKLFLLCILDIRILDIRTKYTEML